MLLVLRYIIAEAEPGFVAPQPTKSTSPIPAAIPAREEKQPMH
jgi:hypothetical protein